MSSTGTQDALVRADGAALVVEPPARMARLHPLAEQTDQFQQGRRAKRTRKAYASDWRDFESWCTEVRLPSLPAEPETVGLYITELAERGPRGPDDRAASWWRSPPTTRTSTSTRRRATGSSAAP
jgi:hypothetical protein